MFRFSFSFKQDIIFEKFYTNWREIKNKRCCDKFWMRFLNHKAAYDIIYYNYKFLSKKHLITIYTRFCDAVKV